MSPITFSLEDIISHLYFRVANSTEKEHLLALQKSHTTALENLTNYCAKLQAKQFSFPPSTKPYVPTIEYTMLTSPQELNPHFTHNTIQDHQLDHTTISIDLLTLWEHLTNTILAYMNTHYYPNTDNPHILIGKNIGQFLIRGNLPDHPITFHIKNIKLTYLPTMYGTSLFYD